MEDNNGRTYGIIDRTPLNDIWCMRYKDEADKVEFHAFGFKCEVRRTDMGHLCGYVYIPVEHVAYGVHYSYDYEDENAMTCVADLDVHGGITYSDMDDRDNPVMWVIGFDCAHYRDYTPSMRGSIENYKDIEYVMNETRLLAAQLYGMQIGERTGRMLEVMRMRKAVVHLADNLLNVTKTK